MKFLARQGLPLRGHGDEADSNFMQLMKLRGEDDARITNWLQRKIGTQHLMQNKILKTMALLILRGVVEMISVAPFLTIMIDETTDVSNTEQVVICFRWVGQSLETHEEFIGLYQGVRNATCCYPQCTTKARHICL